MKQIVEIIRSLIEKLPPSSFTQEILIKLGAVASDNLHSISHVRKLLDKQLQNHASARPIIQLLRTHHANNLVETLRDAGENALVAFASLCDDDNITALVNICLSKGNNDIQQAKRLQIIEFLRQTNLNEWLDKKLKSLVEYSSIIFSAELLLTFVEPKESLERLTAVHSLMKDYPFLINPKALSFITTFSCSENNPALFQAYLNLMTDFIARVNFETLMQWMEELEQKDLLCLIDQCLVVALSHEAASSEAAKKLLNILCAEALVKKEETLTLIRARLDLLPVPLTGEPSLTTSTQILIEAQVLLPEKHRPKSNLLRFLLSPHCIAASTPEKIQHVSDKFSWFCWTLNFTEFQALMGEFKDNYAHHRKIRYYLNSVNQKLTTELNARAYWLEKANKLSSFAIKGMANALFLKLETTCDMTAEREMALQALSKLYPFYYERFGSLRPDLLFRFINTAYHYVSGSASTSFNAQHPLKNSLESLLRAKEVNLYDPQGKKIGFLDESNQASILLETGPILLGLKTDTPVYDRLGILMGYADVSGKIKISDPVKRQITAELLMTMSEKDLSASSLGLKLLITNVLFENTLAFLYSSIDDDAKRTFIEENIVKVMSQISTPLGNEVLDFLAKSLKPATLHSLLSLVKGKENGQSFFCHLLNRNRALFAEQYKAEVALYFQQHDMALCLTNFLINHFNKAWFAEGLSFFVAQSKTYEGGNILDKALSLLKEKAYDNELLNTLFQQVLAKLVSTEETLKVVLHGFCELEPDTVSETNPNLTTICTYFNKNHLLAAMQQLDKRNAEDNPLLYQLIFFILITQRAQLFPDMSGLRLQTAWHNDELDILFHFLKTHLSKKRAIDPEWEVGKGVLGEGLIYCANSGHTSVFYDKRVFNQALVSAVIDKPSLQELIAKYWLTPETRKQLVTNSAMTDALYNPHSLLNNRLVNNTLWNDWRYLLGEIMHETSVEHRKKLPLICIYLLNYTGPKKPLILLLIDFFKYFQHNPDYLNPVCCLITQFPHRKVSAAIFDALMSAVIKTPSLLNTTLLKDMGRYYSQSILNQGVSTPTAELNLLVYWGQSKCYAAAHQGCQLLAQDCSDLRFRRRLEHAAKEAVVEGELSVSSESSYFWLLKAWKRLVNYGFNAVNNTTGIVKFCENTSANPHRSYCGTTIDVPPPVNEPENSSGAKFRHLMNLFAQITRSRMPLSTVDFAGNQHALFVHIPHRETKVVGVTQAVVHI